MGDINFVVVITALLGAGGIGAVLKTVIDSIVLARSGISGREDRRRADIIAQRDLAIQQAKEARADAAASDARADREADSRRRYQEAHARLRRRMIEQGIEPGGWPDIDENTEPPNKETS